MTTPNNPSEAQAFGSQVDTLNLAFKIALSNGWTPSLDTGSESDQKRYVLKHSDKLEYLIYNHDFAKALWGGYKSDVYTHQDDDPPDTFSLARKGNVGWQYHLQQMVIAADPIEYLAQVITATTPDSSQTEPVKNAHKGDEPNA